MKKTFTLLIAAIAAILLFTKPMMVMGQTKTAPQTSDFTWPSPQLSENFNSLSATSSSGNSSSATTLSSQTAFGIFDYLYCGKDANTWSIESNNTFGSKVFKLHNVGTKYLITSVTGKTFSTQGAFSIKIAKTDKCYFGLYADNENNLLDKAKASVYLQNNDGALYIHNGQKNGWISIGSYTGDIIEVCVIYNNNNTSTTYGDGISLGATNAHIYVNGTCVMDGESPKAFSIPGATLSTFRGCPMAANGNNCTMDDVKIYSTLPTAASTNPTITVDPESITGFNYVIGDGPSAHQSFTVSGSNLEDNIYMLVGGDYELSDDAETWPSPSVSEWTLDIDSDGNVAETTLYIRLKAGLAAGTHNSSIAMQADEAEAEITLTGSVTNAHTITYSDTNGSISGVDSDSNAVASGASVAEGATVTLTATPNDGYKFTSWSVYGTGSELSSTTTNPTTFTMGTANSTVTANFTAVWTVTLNSNGAQQKELVVKTQSISLTKPFNTPSGYKYVGWTLDPESPSTLVATTYTPTDNVTLYAVFRQIEYGDYEKVEENLADWNGNYLIVNEDVSWAFDGSLAKASIDADNNYISVSISSKKITSNTTTDASAFTITSVTGGYSIKSASGVYIGRTGSSNGMEESNTDDYINLVSYDKKPLIQGTTSTGTGTYYLRYNSGNKRFRYYDSSAQSDIQLYKQKETYSGYYTTISNPTIPGSVVISAPTTISSDQTFGSNLNITQTITISNNAIVKVNGTITNASASNLVIEEGSQLINSKSVAATMKKGIDAASKADKVYGWYAISSPVHTGNNTYESPSDVANLILTPANTYDLFYYNEPDHTWMNYKVAAFNLNKGQGYIYRNSTGDDLTFVGNTNVGNATYTLKYNTSGDQATLKGFNLIGNPYPHSIYKGTGTAIESSDLTSGFYTLSNSGSWTPGTDNTTEIKPEQGILVEAISTANDKTLTITDKTDKSAPAAKSNNDNIIFIVSNSQYEDVAYAWFDKGYGLSKIDHRNAEVPMLFIPQDGHNYAIAMMNDETQSFNLNFKAMTTGKYTLSYKANGNYSYLHVIDRLTGTDVDMLLDGEYSFIGSPKDSDNRFIVKLSYDGGTAIAENEIFAFQNGNDIYVTGNGELQIFDVTGRSVMTTTISGAESINLSAQGVYIFRLIGSEIKTQKIVVR